MATTSEHVDNNVNTNISDDDKKKKEEEEAKKLQSSSNNGDQGNKTTEKVDDLNQIGKTDTLSSIQSTNEDKKSDQTSSTLNETSDTSTEKKNEEKTVETTTITQQKEKSGSTPISSTSTTDNNIKTEETTTIVASSKPNNDEDNKKDKSATSLAISNDTKKEESTTVTSDDKIKNEESTPQLAASDSNKDKKKDDDNFFPIEKGDEQHLTDFQRQKAKYFFNVNLDIENKEYVTWEDVEFYLLFHATTAGKEGSYGDDLEARLSRAARAFWEHVHDQIPLPDEKRDKLTLDQFLDTWSSLIDYVVRTNQLPPIIQDLVKLGFELYSTDNGEGKPATIQPSAFDQLFQKMNLGRPYAIMAYKYLTENGKKPLDADKIDSLVKAVITSSDDEHDSHFLLPGFFKTIATNKNNEKDNKNKSPPPSPDKEQSKDSDKSSATPTSPPPTLPHQPQPSNESSLSSSQLQQPDAPSSSSLKEQQKPSEPPPSSPKEQQKPSEPPPLSPKEQQKPSEPPPSSPKEQQKPSEPPPSSPKEQQKPSEPPPSSSQSQQQNRPSSPSPQEQKLDSPRLSQKQSISTSQNEVIKSPKTGPSTSQQQNIQLPPKSQKAAIQQEDENIRHLFRYYHIDDGDIVEVAGGSIHRLVLLHPERPLPPYIQQNKQLLQKLQAGLTDFSSVHIPPNRSNDNEKSSPSQEVTATSAEKKPKVTLEERVSQGEAQKGPTKPLRQEQKQESLWSTGVRQVYPQLSAAQQEEQRRQAKLQATQPVNDEKKTKEQTSAANNVSSSKQDDKTDLIHDEEDKIIAAVLKQLAPIIEKRVAAELRRIHSGETDEDEDDSFIPFPFMLAGGNPFFAVPRGGPPPQVSKEQQQTSQQNAANQGQQQQAHGPRETDFGGLPDGAGFFPPQLFMTMMNNLARGGMGGEIPSFPPNMPPPPHGADGAPVGVEGFVMFVDDDEMMGGPPGHPLHPGPRF